MFKTNRLLYTAGLLLALSLPGSAQVNLTVGDLNLSPSLFDGVNNVVIQVPILMEDMETLTRAANGIRSITYTIQISGDTDIIANENMLVSNAYIGTLQFVGTPSLANGIENPGVDLANANGAATPDATGLAIHNTATAGGSTHQFDAGDQTIGGTWVLNNDFMTLGHKRGNLPPPGPGIVLGTTPATPVLIGVLEIEILGDLNGNANAQLVIEANNDDVLYNYVQLDDPGPDDSVDVDFSYPKGFARNGNALLGTVNIFETPNCSGATVSDDNGTASGSSISILYNDITAGGNGGAVTLSIPTGNAEQFVISDGTNEWTVSATPGTTTHTVDTAADGSPIASQNTTTYTITPQAEFPPASGTFVSGSACEVNVIWAPVSCSVSFLTTPVLNGGTDVEVVLTNGRFNGVDYGDLDIAVVGGMSSVALTGPTGGGTNVLTFTMDIADLDNITSDDVGSYTANVEGAGASNLSSCSTSLALEPPDNQTTCETFQPTDAVIGSNVTLALTGNSGVIDWDVTYNGVTTNTPSSTPSIGPAVGNTLQVSISANGFDEGGNPVTDENDPLVCDLTFVAAACGLSSQDLGTPGSPVDFGTVVTLTLSTTGAVDAKINGVSGSPSVDPFTNNDVTWTWSYTAVSDETVSAVLTNPNGEETTCTNAWEIDINCIPGEIVTVAQVGGNGVTISGTNGCVYTVLVTTEDSSTEYQVSIGESGTGFLNITIPPDADIEVGQGTGSGFVASDAIFTVPTLGEWGMIAFMTLLMGAGVFFMRRNRIA